jgi:O-antigen/teichoic acid export membrane protein
MLKKIKKTLGKDTNLKELISGSAITFVIKITGMLISYVVVLIVSRKYGAEGTGIYSLTISILNGLAIFGCLGLNIAVLRYVGQYNATENGMVNIKKLFRYILQLAFPFSLLLGIALFFLSEEIAVSMFQNPTYIPALKVSSIVLPFFTLNLINVEFIRGLKLLKVSEYLRSINRQLVVLVILVFSLFSFGILDSVYAMALGVFISFFISLIFILNFFKKSKIIKKNVPDLGKKELIRTSIPMMISAVASFILTNAGAFFLEFYSTTDQVGIFNVCLRLAQLVSLVLVVVNTISAPKFAELYWAGKKEELQRLIQQSSKVMFIVSLIISVALILGSKIALGFFGKKFIHGFSALTLLVIGQLINAISGSVGIFLNMSGNQKILRNIILVTMIFLIMGYIYIVPDYGVFGAAVVTVLGTFVMNAVSSIYVYRKYNFVFFYIPFLKFKY